MDACRGGDSTRPSATIQPDHTTFLANAPPEGYVGVGPTVCLEIKPKWGLRPGAAGEPPDQLPQHACGNAGPGAGVCTEAAASGSGAGVGGSSGCGDSPAQTGGHCFHPGRRYPRFMLHMLLKHVKDGAPLSLYNPLDLFSGQLDRMQRALRCLLQEPSNNLRVFIDGFQVYGAAVKAAAGDAKGAGSGGAVDVDGSADGGSGGRLEASGGSGSVTHGSAGLRQLAAELRAFVSDNAPQGSCASNWVQSNAGHGAGTHQQCAGAAAVAGGGQDGGVAGGLLPLAGPAGCEGLSSSPSAAAVVAGLTHSAASGADGVLEALVRLTALALQREGVMSRLHDVQALDPLGAQGALRLYGQLQEALQAGGFTPVKAADAVGPSAVAAAGAGVTAGAAAGAGGDWTPALQALRHYLTSVTAKDCAVMVTLQRAQRHRTPSTEPPSAAVAEPPPAVAAAAAAAVAERQAQPLPQSASPSPGRPWVGLLVDPGLASPAADGQSEHAKQAVQAGQAGHSGQANQAGQTAGQSGQAGQAERGGGVAYLYKVAFVDLDVKAASKIPRHADLEAELMECAQQHAELLRDYAARAGFTDAAV